MPSRSIAPGRLFCTNTSALATSRASASAAPLFFTSSTSERLLRFTVANVGESPATPPMWRRMSPGGGSTLITSAPWSASTRVASGPAITWLKSITRNPSSAPGMVASSSPGFYPRPPMEIEGERREPRGVHNPRVIDLITPDPSSGEVVLVMLEERPWESEPEQLRQLEAKFNAYLEYALGGHLAVQYAEYAERPVRVQLECAENPRPADNAFFTAIANFAEAEGILWLV